jgi:hypothetical protein
MHGVTVHGPSNLFGGPRAWQTPTVTAATAHHRGTRPRELQLGFQVPQAAVRLPVAGKPKPRLLLADRARPGGLPDRRTLRHRGPQLRRQSGPGSRTPDPASRLGDPTVSLGNHGNKFSQASSESGSAPGQLWELPEFFFSPGPLDSDDGHSGHKMKLEPDDGHTKAPSRCGQVAMSQVRN